MASMTDFIAVILRLIADFFAADPIIYLFCLLCLIVLIKVFRLLMP